MDAGEDTGTTWLPVAEAAQRLGITIDGLRSRIRRGLVKPRRGNDGRLLVPVATHGPATGLDPSTDAGADSADETVADLREENGALRVQVARIEERLAASERREGETAAALAKAEARADRLEAELRELRRPLLLRMLETLRRR